MKIFWPALLLVAITMAGCSKEPRINLEVYINPKGAPCFRWNQNLLNETKSTGIVSLPNGAILESAIRRNTNSDPINIKLNLHIDKLDQLTIEGTSQSHEDYQINFDGLINVNATVQVNAGDHKIQLSGKLYKVYEN